MPRHGVVGKLCLLIPVKRVCLHFGAVPGRTCPTKNPLFFCTDSADLKEEEMSEPMNRTKVHLSCWMWRVHPWVSIQFNATYFLQQTSTFSWVGSWVSDRPTPRTHTSTRRPVRHVRRPPRPPDGVRLRRLTPKSWNCNSDRTHIYPRLPGQPLIGFTESTKDFTLQKPGQPFFKWSWNPRVYIYIIL